MGLKPTCPYNNQIRQGIEAITVSIAVGFSLTYKIADIHIFLYTKSNPIYEKKYFYYRGSAEPKLLISGPGLLS